MRARPTVFAFVTLAAAPRLAFVTLAAAPRLAFVTLAAAPPLLLLTLAAEPRLLTVEQAVPVAAQEPAPPPRVRLLATGGTISNKAGGRLSAEDLIKSVPNLERYARAEGEQFANTASSALTLRQWIDLARRINALFAEDTGLAGIVVTSGTDTLEETAYFLNLSVKSDKSVVVVGSMRNPSTLGYEGAANLLQGFRVAADPASRGKGVLVVLNDEINAAREVTKTDALRLHTFQTRGYGILGVVDDDRVVFYRDVVRRHTNATEFDVSRVDELPRVDVVLVYQGATADVIKALVDQGAKGIVIASAGAGATSGTQGEGIRYAIEKGVFVVTSTRAGSGRIAAWRRPGPPSGAAAPPTYRIAAEDLPPLKARILLMLALTRTKDGNEIQRMFTEY